MFLLDSNVLVALAQRSHVHHEAARNWFELHKAEGWATCLLTEAAFVRVLCTVAPAEFQSPEIALRLLGELRRTPHHAFFSATESLVELHPLLRRVLFGPNQVPDFVLLDLAFRNEAKLATFDARLVRAIGREPSLLEWIELIPAVSSGVEG